MRLIGFSLLMVLSLPAFAHTGHGVPVAGWLSGIIHYLSLEHLLLAAPVVWLCCWLFSHYKKRISERH